MLYVLAYNRNVLSIYGNIDVHTFLHITSNTFYLDVWKQYNNLNVYTYKLKNVKQYKCEDV